MKLYWKDAFGELKKTSSITGAAFLASLSPVLGMFTIVVNKFLQIGFTSLVHAMTGYLYGPIMACVAGGLADLIKYLIRPTGPFFPGFTLNEMLVGFIYGAFFYKKEITLPRVIGARLVITFGINLILTPLWLAILYGNAYKFMVPARLIKNLVMIPVDVFLRYTVLKFSEKNIKNRLVKNIK